MEIKFTNYTEKLTLSLLMILLTTACHQEKTALSERPMTRIELIAADQQASSYESKLNLATEYLNSGEFQLASLYLDEAERRSDQKLTYRYYSLRCRLAAHVGDDQQVMQAGEKALALNEDDPLAIALVVAAAAARLDRRQTALTLYENLHRRSREEARFRFDYEDGLIYLGLLVDEKRWNMVESLLDDFINWFGFRSGFGLIMAAAYEQQNKPVLSLFAAAEELDFQRYNGVVESEAIHRRIEEISAQTGLSDDDPFHIYCRGLIHYFTGEYEQAEVELSSVQPQDDAAYYHFLRIMLAMYNDNQTAQQYDRLLSFEPRYRAFAGYYHHLWNIMKRGDGQYGFRRIRVIIEKSIIMAPYSRYAEEGRLELGALLNLTPEESRHLITDAEMEQIIIASEKGDFTTEQFVPLWHQLTLPDNYYTQSCILMLRLLAANRPDFIDYLQGLQPQLPRETVRKLQIAALL